MPSPPNGLLLVTDRRQAGLPLVEICRSALAAGFVGVMVREKDLPGAPLLELASPIAALCRERGAICLVNDRLDVALALESCGAHVGASGIPVPDARRLLGSDRVLGYSAHDRDEAAAVLEAGADYVTLSPVFPSRSKPDLLPRGFPWFAQGCAALPPGRVLALGGVETGVLGRLRAGGAAGAAVMGAMMRARHPGETAAGMLAAWEGSPPGI